MVANQVYKIFESIFHEYWEKTTIWFPAGKDSIRVRLANGEEFIFTYEDSHNWCLETVDLHLRRMKGGAKMR